jgi:hypothetical protein
VCAILHLFTSVMKMKEPINKLEKLLALGLEYISKTPDSEMAFKPSPEKWSKKEILGHLIDSGVNNLQRFIEIQIEDKPYRIRLYNQDELVKVNDYQNSETKEIIDFWLAVNNRIKVLINLQTEETLNFKIELYENDFTDLRFLMTDYVEHTEHHLKQIMESR